MQKIQKLNQDVAANTTNNPIRSSDHSLVNQDSTSIMMQNQNTDRSQSKNRGSSKKKQQFHRSTIQVKQLSLEQQMMYQTQTDGQKSKHLSIFDEITDVKNRHFQSQNRANTPLETQTIDSKVEQNHHTQSLNREFSGKTMGFNGKNQLYFRQSMLSRNSSVKSFAERSQKEILSPFYKPFEIFFTNRKKSPYLTQRSQNQSTCSPKQDCGGTFQSSQRAGEGQMKNSMLINSFQPQNTYANIKGSFRSKTPSFHTIMSDKIKNSSKKQRIQENTSNSQMRSVQSYFNQHIKKKIMIEYSTSATKNRKCNQNNLKHMQVSMSKDTQHQNNHQPKFNNKFQCQLQSQCTRRNSRNKPNNTYQAQDKNRLQKLRSEQAKFLRNSEDDLNYSTDNDFDQGNNRTQVISIDARQNICTSDQCIQANLIQSDHQNFNEQQICCHSEGQRHQMTRYALEKALKLAEVLMKEVQRLDNVVQNQKHILVQNNLVEGRDLKASDSIIEKKQMSKVKRELFKEIENLNKVQQDNVINPEEEALKNLYQSNNLSQSQQSHNRSHGHHRQSKHQKENNNNPCLKDSSYLLADVAACVKQLDRKLSGRILGRS